MHLPDTFHTNIGEQPSTKFQHWIYAKTIRLYLNIFALNFCVVLDEGAAHDH